MNEQTAGRVRQIEDIRESDRGRSIPPSELLDTLIKPRRGKFIALEGVDGTGKSTQAKILAKRIGAYTTFEPGSTRIGAKLRKIVLSEPELDLRAEALLMAADRAQNVHDIIQPALCGGTHVVTDRYIGSSLAYQGYGRGHGLGDIMILSEFSSEGVYPDLNILLHGTIYPTGKGDRIERLGQEFFERVIDGYTELAEGSPDRWAVIDNTGTPDEVAERIHATVQERLEL